MTNTTDWRNTLNAALTIAYKITVEQEFDSIKFMLASQSFRSTKQKSQICATLLKDKVQI